MASYAFFLLVGLYPVPATRQFLLSSPSFPTVSFVNPLFGTTTTVHAKNLSQKAIYVQVRASTTRGEGLEQC